MAPPLGIQWRQFGGEIIVQLEQRLRQAAFANQVDEIGIGQKTSFTAGIGTAAISRSVTWV
jgi:hypothetical protein